TSGRNGIRRPLIRLLLALGVASALAARPAAAEWASGSQGEVPLDGAGGAWRVRATLDGSMTGLFLVDTGASLCVLSPAVARRLRARRQGDRSAGGPAPRPVGRSPTGPHSPLAALGRARGARGDRLSRSNRRGC